MPPATDLRLVVGYDGSPPASRALDAAAVGLACHSPVPLVVVP
jgi:hypothetical protein